MKVEFETHGVKHHEYNEDNEMLMNEVAEDIMSYAKFEIDPCITFSKVSNSLSESQFNQFINLIDENIGHLYLKHYGSNWKQEKIREMKESGLIYIWFQSDEQLTAYISFKLCFDDDEHLVIYLYEIHIRQTYQNKGIGRHLMDQLFQFVAELRMTNNKLYKLIQGTSLTVFSDNLAFKWYKSLGYVLTSNSPRDKRLRGKSIKPNYYLMTRLN